MKVENTADWPWERLEPYGKDITAAFAKLVERFPNDVTVESLAQDCIKGLRQLWLIMDDDGRFISFVMTEMRTVEATGHKQLTITSFAGEEGINTVPLIRDIEDWGRENGAKESTIVGRRGWTPALATQGYKADAVLFRKPL